MKKRKRIGIISGHFRNHSVMDFYFHTIINMPKEYNITLIHTKSHPNNSITTTLNKRANNQLLLPQNIDESRVTISFTAIV